MPGARKPGDPALLDALDAFDRVRYIGDAWRVVRDGRAPLQGNASGGRWDATLFDVLYTSPGSGWSRCRSSLSPVTPAGLSVEDQVRIASHQSQDSEGSQASGFRGDGSAWCRSCRWGTRSGTGLRFFRPVCAPARMRS